MSRSQTIVVSTISEMFTAFTDGSANRDTQVACAHCPWLGDAVMFPPHLLACPDQSATQERNGTRPD